MIVERTGDLFTSDCPALGHGVNTLGAGIAVEFRRRWPALYEAYREACRSGRLQPGGIFVWQAPDRLIVNLATQRGVGRGAARLAWVRQAARATAQLPVAGLASSNSVLATAATQCSPYDQDTAFYPVVTFLARNALRLDRQEPPERQLDRLEAWVRHFDVSAHEAVPLLAALLSIPLAGRYLPSGLAPEPQKQRTIELLIRMLLQEAGARGTAAVVEDLHWADPSTLDLLDGSPVGCATDGCCCC